MSNSTKNSGDSPGAFPNASSENPPGRTDRNLDAATAGPDDTAGLPAYMRGPVREEPSDSSAAPVMEKEPSSAARFGDENIPPAGESPSSPETQAPAGWSQLRPLEDAGQNAGTAGGGSGPEPAGQGATPFAASSETALPDDGRPGDSEAGRPAGGEDEESEAGRANGNEDEESEAGQPIGDRTPEPAPAAKPAESFSRRPVPARYSFAGAHPLLAAGQSAPPSLCSRLFDGLALFPLLPLTVLLVLQTIFTLDARALWFSDEIRHAAAFQALLDQGKWLILEMNGQPYPDKPPLYFLFLRGLYELVRTDGPMLHFTAAAVSALLYLWAALGLGRFAIRVDSRTNLAAGFLLLSTGYIMGVMHYARMDLLFSALILCSHTALYRAFVSPTGKPMGMILGFVLAGLACLVKGPLGLAMPLCSILFFAVWRGTPLRLFRPDFLVGLIAGLIPIALWLGAIYWTTGSADFILNSLIKQQVVERAVDTFHHKEAWSYYLLRLPLMVLPWTLLLFFLPWENFLGRNMRTALAASRRPEGEGLAFLWSMVFSALVLLSLLSGKILIYFLPVLPALALLAARAVLMMEKTRAGLFRRFMALLMLSAAVALILGSLALFGLLPVPAALGLPQWKLPANSAFFIVAAVFLLFSGLLWTGLRSSRPEGTLLVMALAATALSYPLAALVAPSFDAVLSPKAQALLMRAYAQDGYAPASYKVYGGLYTYYAGQTVPALGQLPASANGKMVIGMQRSRLKEWENKPDCFTEVHSQWIETREYVLLACPAREGLQPAAVPYKPAPDLVGELMKLMGLRFPAKQEGSKTPEAAPKKSGTLSEQPSGEENAPSPGQPPLKEEDAPRTPAPPKAPEPETAPAPAEGSMTQPEAPPAAPAEKAAPADEPAAQPEAGSAAPAEQAAPPASRNKAQESAAQPGEPAFDAAPQPDAASGTDTDAEAGTETEADTGAEPGAAVPAPNPADAGAAKKAPATDERAASPDEKTPDAAPDAPEAGTPASR